MVAAERHPVLHRLVGQELDLAQRQPRIERGLGGKTDAVAIAVAEVDPWTMSRFAGHDDVPRLLEDAAGDMVLEVSVQKPVTVMLPCRERDGLDSFARGRELRAARCAEDFGHGDVGPVEVGPDACEVYLFQLVPILFLGVDVDVVGAAGFWVTAEIEVADAGDVVVAELAEHLGQVPVLQVVIVPCFLAGVDEDAGVGEIVVVVDNVGEVDHCFVAFVDGWMERGGWVVCEVDGRVEVGKFAGDPGGVFVAHAGDDEGLTVFMAHRFRDSWLEQRERRRGCGLRFWRRRV